MNSIGLTSRREKRRKNRSSKINALKEEMFDELDDSVAIVAEDRLSSEEVAKVQERVIRADINSLQTNGKVTPTPPPLPDDRNETKTQHKPDTNLTHTFEETQHIPSTNPIQKDNVDNSKTQHKPDTNPTRTSRKTQHKGDTNPIQKHLATGAQTRHKPDTNPTQASSKTQYKGDTNPIQIDQTEKPKTQHIPNTETALSDKEPQQKPDTNPTHFNDLKTRHIPDTKLADNRKTSTRKTRYKPDTFEGVGQQIHQTQTQHKPDTKSLDLVGSIPPVKPDTNPTQDSSINYEWPDVSIYALRHGLGRRIIEHLTQLERLTGEGLTPNLTYVEIAESIGNTTATSVRGTVIRMEEKWFLRRYENEGGRSVGPRFTVNPKIQEQLIRKTLNDHIQSEPIEETWKSINIAALEKIQWENQSYSLRREHILKIAKKSEYPPETVQHFIDVFAFDIQHNNKLAVLKNGWKGPKNFDPIAFFVGSILNGNGYDTPSNYVSLKEASLDKALKTMRELSEREEAKVQELIALQFEPWLKSLSPNDRQTFNSFKGFSPEPNTKAERTNLMEYFRTEVFPKLRELGS